MGKAVCMLPNMYPQFQVLHIVICWVAGFRNVQGCCRNKDSSSSSCQVNWYLIQTIQFLHYWGIAIWPSAMILGPILENTGSRTKTLWPHSCWGDFCKPLPVCPIYFKLKLKTQIFSDIIYKTSPQAKRHKPSLLFTSSTILTFITT